VLTARSFQGNPTAAGLASARCLRRFPLDASPLPPGVRFVVEADGTLSDIRIQQSTGFASLDEASIEAIKQAKFSRGTLDGVPIAASTVLYLIWRLPET
jgi:TonB family protein